ncbi:unnamed protein product [Diamesa hyperborea]
MDYCEDCLKDSTKMDSNPQEYRSHYMSRQQSQHFYLTNQQQQTNYQSFRRRNLLFNFDVISKTLLLLVLLASLIQLSVASIPCSNYEYWDSKRDMCLQCTKCDVQMIVVSPCQAHKDTNCGPMSKLEIDWSQFRATEVNRKDHRIPSTIDPLSAQASTANEEEEILWDWQMLSLVLAGLACFLFFTITAVISINYVRQWRNIKKQFDTDIEELSTQLMARLAVPQLESGSMILIDDPTTKNHRLGPKQIEVRCVYLEEILAGKDPYKTAKTHGKHILIRNGPGNVYIEENSNEKHQHIGHKFI